jgi:hypothetical protein
MKVESIIHQSDSTRRVIEYKSSQENMVQK